IYLSGRDADSAVDWNFRVSKGMNSGKWKRIAVPSCWEQEGFGEYTYGRYYKKEGATASDETGLYIHEFSVPSSWRGKKIELVFEGVMTDADVKVNGRSAGPIHQGGFTSFSYDVTSLVVPGRKNKLEVSVAKQSADASVNNAERRADWWLFGGIYRPVFLRALPERHISHAGIDARADGTLNVRLTTSDLPAGYRLRTEVAGLGTQETSIQAGQEHDIIMKWDGVRPWNTESPDMYEVTFSLISPEGETVHTEKEKVGFRTIEFRERDGFYLNGTKLRIKGVNRHCFYPETGRTASRRRDLEDLKLIKGMNVNAIRSHYPPDRHLLDLCDSLGILYFNELPGWQNSYSTPTGSRILREMLTHDANHPSIFAWGNGNEGGNNLALDSLFGVYDPQRRHVVHPWALWNGVDSHHYPAYQTGVGRLANGHQVFMPTEFLHAQYDKGAGTSLDEYWEMWEKNPLFAGGFIWAFADEGVMRTDRGGEIDTDGANAPDGIVGPHREKEGSWFTVRDVWSPVQIPPFAVRSGWDGSFLVSNRFMFSNLDRVRMVYEIQRIVPGLATAESVGKGEVILPSIGPGETGRARLPIDDIVRSGDLMTLAALTQDGDTINVWSYPMKYADEYYNSYIKPTYKGNAMVDGHTLEGAGVKASFDSDTGMLVSVMVDGKKAALSNGPVPVGMKMSLDSVTSRQNSDGSASLVMRYKGAVDSIVWTMKPNGILDMDAVILNRRDGGGYKGEFFDGQVKNLGFSFDCPEDEISGMTWLGRGPYRVWRNRQRGANIGLWHKAHNNTVTGQPDKGRLVYPEFKGYHGNLYWATMESDNRPFTVYSETDGVYFRVFTPEEPSERPYNTMEEFPTGDISFLFEIPGMRSYKPIEQLGPSAQPSHIRINKGDNGLRMRLHFDFRTPRNP
ncbi:MAG: beta-galactosidase, partial [Muribaculaceae bacterium]|nr:beta-galactosidase [Muribaculaceae bacterium]